MTTIAEPAEVAPQPHDLTEAEFALMMTPGTQGAAAAGTAGPGPEMRPPGEGTGTDRNAAGATVISGQLITALFAEQSNRNAWAHLQTAGWKRLSPLTDTGSTAMTVLAAHARAVGSAPYADENPVGTLVNLYVW